ncbi:MAG: hypothetical protein KDB22_06490 [Planctomycetales bacterium]|nr:hypothetical protein [Planctomycetales bacterium]
MTGRTRAFAITTIAATFAIAAVGQQPLLGPKVDDELFVLMRAKLSSSQKVVEGLMAGDFTMIRQGGEEMQKICDSSQWRHAEDQVVGHYRSELKRSAMKLVAQAGEENLEGAAYTYMHTLSTCINCHQYSRNVLRVAKIQGKSGVVSIPVTEQENAAYQNGSLYR